MSFKLTIDGLENETIKDYIEKEHIQEEIYEDEKSLSHEDLYGVSENARGGTELMRDRILNRIDPDLRDYFQFVISRKRKMTKKPKIFWAHDLPQDPEVQFLKDKESWDEFSKIIFVSHWQQQLYNIILGIPYEKGFVLQNCIDPIPCPSDKGKPVTDGKVKIMYASTPHRGLDVLLLAVELMQHRDDFELEIYSDFKIYDRPEWEENVKPLYEKAQEIKNVTYNPSVPNDVIREKLAESHILAYPSTYLETSCLTVIEAMSARNIVICPNLAALPETTSNFAWMYNWESDKSTHVYKFASILQNAIDQVKTQDMTDALNFQQAFFNRFFNTEARVMQWNHVLSRLRDEIEQRKS